MTTIPLSISTTYVPTWGVNEGVRELFQNAFDAESEASWEYNMARETLRISNKHSLLTRDTLLFGATSKADNKEAIGSFGEGYKLALLVLTRAGKNVVIHNHGANEEWIPRFKVAKSMNNAQMLVIDINKVSRLSKEQNDLDIVIHGITEDEYAEIVERTLPLQSKYECIEGKDGQVLLEEKHKGKLFVNGLYISTSGELHYGYNFKPDVVKLNRDRNMIDGWDLYQATGRMCKMMEKEAIVEALTEEYPDVKHLSLSAYQDKDIEVTETIATKLLEKYGESTKAATSQSEADVLEKLHPHHKVVVVPRNVADVINESPLFKTEEVEEEQESKTLFSAINDWIKLNMDYMPTACITELLDILDEYKVVEVKR